MRNFHPAADAFPLMDAQRFSELREDIKERGQIVPITICDDAILDGRNRYKACLELGIEPKEEHFTGDPWLYVWSLNGQRRDIGAEQRYLIWKFCYEHSDQWVREQERIWNEANKKRSVSIQTQPRTEDGKFQPIVEQIVPLPVKIHKTRESKAILSKTNKGAVQRGDQLAKERPDLAEKVRKGEMKPSEATRALRIDKIKSKPKQPLPNGVFDLIYCDPPWKYDFSETSSREIENKYPTMSQEELMALDPPAAPNSVLFMWATAPKLIEALDIMKMWGFEYKTNAVWDKEILGMGYWFRGQHELLLVGTKGSFSPPEEKLRISSVIREKRTQHSKKPDVVYTILENLFPDANRLEMFARSKRSNWSAWGNEVD